MPVHPKRRNHPKKKSGARHTHVIEEAKPEVKPVGLFVTRELDNAIQACKAEVQRIATECRARNMKFRDKDFDLENDGYNCLHSLTGCIESDPQDFQRVTEIFDEPHFFNTNGAAESSAIKQGALGDCYFLAALGVVCCIPGLIEKICVARDEEVGVYGFIFYRDHGWVSVIVDDLLITQIPKYEDLDDDQKDVCLDDKDMFERIARKGGKNLMFARSGSDGETWVPLIEKAYAKLHGNFVHLEGGLTPDAIADLTGGVGTTFVNKDILDTDRFWKEEVLKANKDHLLSAWFAGSSTVQGIFGGHAYSVLRALEYKGKRFVVVRNPWGHCEWTGPWSDGSKEWTAEWTQVLPLLGHVFGNDGQFVMLYSDFLKCFRWIERTFLFDDTWILMSEWMRVPLKHIPQTPSYGALSFNIIIKARTKAILVLSRLNTRSFRSMPQSPPISFDYAVVKAGETKPLATTLPTTGFRASLELELDAGEYVVYVCIDQHFTISPDEDDDFPVAKETSSRAISRVLKSKIQCQSIVKNWHTALKSQFVPKSLDEVITEDLKALAPPSSPTTDQSDNTVVALDASDNNDFGQKENDILTDDAKNPSEGTQLTRSVKPELVAPFPGQKIRLSPFLHILSTYLLSILALFGLIIISHADTEILATSQADQEPARIHTANTAENEEVVPQVEAAADSDVPVQDSISEEPGKWSDLFWEMKVCVILGLRVYTQTAEPAIIVGHLKDSE